MSVSKLRSGRAGRRIGSWTPGPMPCRRRSRARRFSRAARISASESWSRTFSPYPRAWRWSASTSAAAWASAARNTASWWPWRIFRAATASASGRWRRRCTCRARLSRPKAGKLVRRRLLLKRTNPLDRRGVLLSVAPAGRLAVDRVSAEIRTVNDLFFGALDAASFAALSAAAGALVESSAKAVRYTTLAKGSPQSLRNAG